MRHFKIRNDSPHVSITVQHCQDGHFAVNNDKLHVITSKVSHANVSTVICQILCVTSS